MDNTPPLRPPFTTLASDLLNLFFHDPEDPATLWPWGKLAFYLGLLVLSGWLFISMA
ncbi:MAG: hypothetical protein KBA60_06100 [Flavobacteriales bacterium]|nr:hypothetical protein [Flavobacteriales bacterium]